MNKTVTINISGIIFHIEEDAFDRLNNYLVRIKSLFSGNEGGPEIMADIESRIAELLQAALSPAKQVIVMPDVEQVVSVMGRPEDFSGAAEHEDGSSQQYTYERERVKKRLFRNPDDKAIGGVCSGLAMYFDIDTVWVRLAMFLLIFFGGLSLWVYFILWIVMPLARTTADKFAMRGEAANINTIFRSFKEEAEDVKARFNKYGKDLRDSGYGHAVKNNAVNVLRAFFIIIGRLFGLFLVVVGCMLLFGYVCSLMGITLIEGNTDFGHWRTVIFGSHADYLLAIFSFVVVVGIPVLLLVYAGLRLLFRINYTNRWLNLTLGILWTIGFITGLYVAIGTAKQFNESAKLRETFQLHQTGDTIRIHLNPGMKVIRGLEFDNSDDVETYLSNNTGGFYFGENNHQLSVIGFADLNVQEGNTDSVELVITKSARGFDKHDANSNAQAINYAYKQEGDVLTFDQVFTVNEDIKFRAQDVDIKLFIPKGKVVYFDRSVKYLLDDVENTTNTWDGNMVGRRWVMTGRGLQCIDCDGLADLKKERRRTTYRSKRHKGEEVSIGEDGIEVTGEHTHVKIDEDGINIKTPDKEYHIGEERKK
jgi:phage shock protein PspC (stress-responsive transcriptional regulator)